MLRIRQFYPSHILIIYKKLNDRVREGVFSHVTVKGEEQWGRKDLRCTENNKCMTFNFNNNHEVFVKDRSSNLETGQ